MGSAMGKSPFEKRSCGHECFKGAHCRLAYVCAVMGVRVPIFAYVIQRLICSLEDECTLEALSLPPSWKCIVRVEAVIPDQVGVIFSNQRLEGRCRVNRLLFSFEELDGNTLTCLRVHAPLIVIVPFRAKLVWA